jgi:hypothetical protein
VRGGLKPAASTNSSISSRRPVGLLEISQASFSESLNDLIDQIIYFYIAVDDLSPPSRKIRY